MHQPRPYGSFGGASEEDAAAVELLMRRLTNIKQLSGLDSLVMVRTLPSGAIVLARDMGGVFTAIIRPRVEKPVDLEFDGIATMFVPMLFSGVITNPMTKNGLGIGLKLTEQTRKRLVNYKNGKPPDKEVALQRFRIKYGTQFSEFLPKDEGAWFYSQYVQQRPTWYSGAMAEVMQIVGGYGRQDLRELPKSDVERAKMAIPEDVEKKILEQLGRTRLPGYTGRPDIDGQFKYDYKFNSTHGVSFDPSGKPWLIRVDTDGVWAMPLPLVPATTTLAFKDYMDEVEDEEILSILERFGGMPSGEPFPRAGADFQAWRRAGAVIKVCDAADFYSHNAYSTACGWSFNSSGSEGFNTCYDHDEKEGLGYGMAYKMRLRLASVPKKEKFDALGEYDSIRLGAYISSLYELIASNTAVNLAIKYKISRSAPMDILARFKGTVGQSEVDYWNNLDMPPIAEHTGSVSMVSKGWLYHGAKFMYLPQIKFPEPLVHGCLSYDFRPLVTGTYKDKYPNSDTTMFGYYVGDQLKVIKYFREERTYQRGVEDDYDDCMIVGSWTRTEFNGPTVIFGNFYTTDFDKRESFAPLETTTKTVGRDLGYDAKPCFAFDAPFHKPGTLWRNRYFSHNVNVKQVGGQNVAVAICIPYFCRNAAIHASTKSTDTTLITESAEMYSVRDPWSYRFWTYDFLMHWSGSLPVMKGVPFPKDASPVHVEIQNYNPTRCSDFANRGPWVAGLPADYTWLIHPNSSAFLLSGGGGAPSFNPFIKTNSKGRTDTGRLDMSINGEPNGIHNGIPDRMYFFGSPDPELDVFYRDAAKIVFGKSIYANVHETNGSELRTRWGYTGLADHKSAHHFIGVIDE